MEERADNNKPEGWRSPREVASPAKKNSALGISALRISILGLTL